MSTPSPKPQPLVDSSSESYTLDQTLRPTEWEEYVGQSVVKKNLKILLMAAQERSHTPDHLLFYGPPGLGKTTLAHLIAHELKTQIKTTSGPAIERVGDLASVLTNLNPGDILFIDEIHRLNKTIEEVLYPAMESGHIDIIIGKGPSARTIQLDLPPFTLIAATTRIALISSPLRSRFSGGVHKLTYYSETELEDILSRSAKLLGLQIDSGGLSEIAKRSRSTPRTANYLLKRCRDYAQVNKKVLNKLVVGESLKLLQIDDMGLTAQDRELLSTTINKFNGGPVGVSTLAASISEEPATIEEVYEPYLMQIGFLERTQRGRMITKHGYDHMNIPYPESPQERLI